MNARSRNFSRFSLSSPNVIAALLFLLVVLVFSGATRNDFVGYDDPEYVTANGHVRLGLSDAAWAFTSTETGNWHPLTWLSHMLDCQLYDLKPAGHHLTSILLHAASTAMLFLLIFRTTKDKWLSILTAAVFGLHPLRVESVAWVAERKDVLCTLFWIAALASYVKYVQTGPQRKSSRQTRNWYLAALLFYLFGAMSKPMIVTFPFTLLLFDYWPLRRFRDASQKDGEESWIESNRILLLEKIPFLGISAVLGLVTFFTQSKAGAVMSDIGFTTRLLTVPISYCQYLGKFVWPAKLAIFYPRETWPWIASLGALLLLLVLTGAAWNHRRERPWLVFGWCWFLLILTPVIGFIQAGEQEIADRYTYLPSIGITVILIWGLYDVARRWRINMAFAVVLPLAFAVLTVRQVQFWKNSGTLFEHAIQVTKNNYLAHNNLGVMFDHEGRLEEARLQFETALQERPNYADAHNNLGLTFAKLGKGDLAIEHYLEAIRLKPGYAEPHNSLGRHFEHLGKMAEAIEQYTIAIRLKPDYADAHYNLGIALARGKRFDDAIAQFQEAVKYRPDSADAYNNMGVAFDQKGDINSAVRQYIAALTLNPNYTRAHYNLGVALARLNRIDDAISEFENALKLEPNYMEARRNLEALQKIQQPVSRP